MSFNRLNKYRTMWVFVSFDLPTETKADRKAANRFRNNLIKDGFSMFQFSFYIRFCASKENMEVHKNRIRRFLPKKGKVAMIHITDKQFGMMELFQGVLEVEPEKPRQQLELF